MIELQKNKLYIIDDILDKPSQNYLEKTCIHPDNTTPHIPWTWFSDTIKPESKTITPPNYTVFRGGHFVFNLLLHNEEIYNDVFMSPLRSLHTKLQEDIKIVKCKTNFTFREIDPNPKNIFPLHTDLELVDGHNFWTSIYYVNNSDGDTIIFNEDLSVSEKISPKKGRLILFNGNRVHAGQPPMKSNKRIVINYNFILPHITKTPSPIPPTVSPFIIKK